MNDQQPTVVVGIDGSEQSDQAVRWACTEAIRRSWRLHVLHAVPKSHGHPASVAAQVDKQMYERGEKLVRQALALVPETLADVVTTELAWGPAPENLVTRSKDAALTVVGHRGLGGFRGLLLGSVGQHVARHAHGPVAVIRAPADPLSTQVVVGVDDSESARRALTFALDYAAPSSFPITAVHAWSEASLAAPGVVVPITHDPVERSRGEQGLVDRIVEEVTSGRADVQVTSRAVPGHPARVLCELSDHASALIVGSRGREAFAQLLLGSTSHDLLSHARCPVIVVR
jgi:nucleotide-binding universal stress UspA family protein